jgi:regulator of replication initiation timing
MSKRVLLVVAVLCALLGASYGGKVRRDPLNDLETDGLREVALEPDKRLKLYIKYAQARMTAVEQLRSDPKLAADRGKQIHDLLEDFTNIVDELDENVDMYHERGSDLRKPLKELIEANSDWQLRLRTLKEAPTSDANAAKEAREYYFVLETSIDSVNESADNSRKVLAEENISFAEKKKKKK